ncbi:hypothetical protein CLOM_g12062 [Closterium sp. NIES-68]|nr:hypothetical protein CLOM_g12062 [Closterium sp. NIES-68]GJP57969.1 hypothetical protein CLOP_g19885 [Closterium sp. NIES-67]
MAEGRAARVERRGCDGALARMRGRMGDDARASRSRVLRGRRGKVVGANVAAKARMKGRRHVPWTATPACSR